MARTANRQNGNQDPTWVFENNPPMGGAAGEAFTNTLASSGMPPASVLAREAIQNSVDARAQNDSKVAVDFVIKELKGPEKAAFIENLGFDFIALRSSDLGLNEPNFLSSVEKSDVPVNLLFVNDFNTTGLAGDPSDADSKFFRFLLSLGDGGKEHEEHGTGGSYGFGKSVYSSNSAVLTIFAYSRTVDGSGNATSILFGCGYFRKHRYLGDSFTGRAWYGLDQTPVHAHAQQVVTPLRDDVADAMAVKLGFDKRGSDEFGTSVLIVDADLKADDILRGVEDWWWPRLLAHKLDVRVVPPSGVPTFPRPRKRQDLQPFLDAYDLAIGTSPADGKSGFRKLFNKFETAAVGQSGFKVLEKNEKDEFVVDESRIDSVALIRSPLMVVAYHRNWNIATPAMAGAFVGDDDIDDILRASEPPAHDRWDIDARRLQDKTGHKRAVVRRVLDNIKRNLKNCQSSASPPPPPRPKRLTMLERTLASFLTPDKKGSKGPIEQSSAPIHLTYDQEPYAEAIGGQLRLLTRFSVRLKSDEEVDSIRARVRVGCPVLEDGQVGDHIELKLTSGADLTDDGSGWHEFDLTTTPVKFDCVSEAYDPLWTVRFIPEIEEVGASK